MGIQLLLNTLQQQGARLLCLQATCTIRSFFRTMPVIKTFRLAHPCRVTNLSLLLILMAPIACPTGRSQNLSFLLQATAIRPSHHSSRVGQGGPPTQDFLAVEVFRCSLEEAFPSPGTITLWPPAEAQAQAPLGAPEGLRLLQRGGLSYWHCS